jgi:hypothetical protein
MKKIIVILMAAFVLLTVSVSAFATNGGFVSSPSNNQAPELLDVKSGFEDCTSKFAVMSYADRDQLSEEVRANLEAAYTQIIGVQYLDQLNSEVAELAEKAGVSVDSLAVTDMFDISATDCADHENHGKFSITLEPTLLKNFVCLLHYYDGKWNIVEDAKVTGSGTRLEFTESEFSPFAIVVSSAPIVEVIEDNTDWFVFAGVVSGVAAIGAGVTYGVMLNIKRKKFI